MIEMPDEMVSAMAHRRGWKRPERLIKWLFCDDMHCAQAYIAVIRRRDWSELKFDLAKKGFGAWVGTIGHGGR